MKFLKQDVRSEKASRDDMLILNLANLRAELKNSLSPNALVEKILGLEMWNQLIE